MKKSVLILIFLLPIILFGQNLSSEFDVSTGDPFAVVDARSKKYTSVGDGLSISVKTNGEIVIIQKFDSNSMKEVDRNEYEDFPKYAKVQELLNIGGRLYYIFEAYNKKEKTFSVYSREINISDASFKDSKKLFTSSRAVVVGYDYFRVTGVPISSFEPKFDIITSFDESKILIKYRNKPLERNDSKNKDILGFYVFDNEFNEVWGDEVKMPHTEKEMNNLAYSIGSDGTAYMLARINESKTLELISIKNGDLSSEAINIKEGLIFNKLHLKESPNGNILAAGYYANGIDFKMSWSGNMSFSSNINGLYLFEMNQDGKVIKENDYPFSIDFIKKYLSERQKGKAQKREADGKAGIGDLRLREFVINDDGSIVIVGEVNYTKQELWMTKTDYVTHFGNMVITKIDSDGNLVWNEKLRKNQASLTSNYKGLGGLGISYVQGEGAHYIIFADNRKNAELDLDKPAAAHKGGFGGYLTAYKIDDVNGEVEKHLILDLTDIGGVKAYQFYLSRIFETLDKTFMLEIYIKKKLDTMVKMKLN